MTTTILFCPKCWGSEIRKAHRGRSYFVLSHAVAARWTGRQRWCPHGSGRWCQQWRVLLGLWAGTPIVASPAWQLRGSWTFYTASGFPQRECPEHQTAVIWPFLIQPWQSRHCCLAAKSCPTLCDPVDCSPPESSVHGISQARTPEWVAISFSRGRRSRPRDQTHVSCIAGGFFITEPPGRPLTTM